MAKLAKNKRPSMQDVADMARVSRTTVSFILNRKPEADNIPQETQERVWAAVDALGYRPNAIARGLRSQRSGTIGFISDEVVTTPFAGRMIQGAQEFAWEHHYLLLLVNTGGNQAVKQAAVNTLLDRQVDGIIYATMYHRAVHPPKNLREVPAVLLDCFVEDRSLPSVVPDEVRGGFEATWHLLEQGHRRIGFEVNFEKQRSAFHLEYWLDDATCFSICKRFVDTFEGVTGDKTVKRKSAGSIQAHQVRYESLGVGFSQHDTPDPAPETDCADIEIHYGA